MKLKLEDIKIFINSIENNKINQILIKAHKIKISVNKIKKEHFSSANSNNKNDQEKLFHIHNTNEYPLNNSILESEDISENSKTYSTIISPMVGTFYRSPAPNESPFIKKNDIVQQKQTVCIIEAMKLMNEIEAEVNGEIVDILVKDGDIVDCGQALMKVKII